LTAYRTCVRLELETTALNLRKEEEMPVAFDMRVLTEEEHRIYDNLRERSNDFGKSEVDYIFARLVEMRLEKKESDGADH